MLTRRKLIGEVHFRFKQQKDLESLFGGRKTDTIRVMERLLKMGYQNQVVVEMGWPDVGSLKTLGSERTKKVHQEIIRFLRLQLKNSRGESVFLILF